MPTSGDRQTRNQVRHRIDTISTQNRHNFDTFVGIDTKSTQFRHKARVFRSVEGLVEHKGVDANASKGDLNTLVYNSLKRVKFLAS